MSVLATGLVLFSGALNPAHAASAQLTQQAPDTPTVAPETSSQALKSPIQNSTLDAQLFYQLLISEARLKQDPGYAYQLYLQLAKQQKSSQLFQRSVDIALLARAGEQALAAARTWHQTLPEDKQASEYTAQILLALNRPQSLVEPLRSIIQLTPQPQRPQALAGLVRSLTRIADRKAIIKLVDEVTQPWRSPESNIAEAWVANAEAALFAGDADQAFSQLQLAQSINPESLAVGLMAIELMGTKPTAEAMVTRLLSGKPDPMLRLAYARKLLSLQRTSDAAKQLDQVVAQQPDNALAWISLGAARLELQQLDAAELATNTYIATANKQNNSAQALNPDSQPMWDISLGYIKMAQISEQRRQLGQADQWLQKADPAGEKINIQVTRAKLMAAQGKLQQAQALLQSIPEAEPRDALVKINAEVQILREAGQDEAAYQILSKGRKRFPEDADLIYDMGMVADQLKRFDESEALMRQLIALHPDQANAYNALGYSLVERGIRYDEARTLLNKAIQLRPGDAFISDSLGWLEFREGKLNEALVWLKQAYASRQDTEIAAHLGEVLWQLGQREEALKIWREAQTKDANNHTLKSTLARLKVSL